MIETNTILGTFFMLVALTFFIVVIVDRKKLMDHSSESHSYTYALFCFGISTSIGIFLLGGMQNIGPIGLWVLVLGLNAGIAILVLDKRNLEAEVTKHDERKRLRGGT